MHVLQWVAVEADNKEDALSTAKNQLESIMGEEGSGATWYDWFVAGGGRWNPNEGMQYEDDDSMIIAGTDKEAFVAKIDNMISNRKVEFAGYRESHEKSEIDINAKLDSYDGNMQYDFALYPLSKMIDMLQGKWDFNSYYFDLTSWSTNPQWILDKIEKEPESIFLVPIDFHF